MSRIEAWATMRYIQHESEQKRQADSKLPEKLVSFGNEYAHVLTRLAGFLDVMGPFPTSRLVEQAAPHRYILGPQLAVDPLLELETHQYAEHKAAVEAAQAAALEAAAAEYAATHDGAPLPAEDVQFIKEHAVGEMGGSTEGAMLAATFGAAGNAAKNAVVGTAPGTNVEGGVGTGVNGCQLFTFVMEDWYRTYSEEGAIRSEVPGAGLAKDPDAMIRIWELGYPDEIASIGKRTFKSSWGKWKKEKALAHLTPVRDSAGRLTALIVPGEAADWPEHKSLTRNNPHGVSPIVQMIYSAKPKYEGQVSSMRYEGTELYPWATVSAQQGRQTYGKIRLYTAGGLFKDFGKIWFKSDFSGPGYLKVEDGSPIGCFKRSKIDRTTIYTVAIGVDPGLFILIHTATLKCMLDGPLLKSNVFSEENHTFIA